MIGRDGDHGGIMSFIPNVGAPQSTEGGMQMRIISLFATGVALSALTACTDQPSLPEGANSSARQDASSSDEEIERMTGVSSEGMSYPIEPRDAQESAFEAGQTGTGEEVLFVKSQAEFSALLNLKPLDGGFDIKSIIPPTDDRKLIANTKVYPASAQVLIALPGGRCSGAMIGKDLVITAGHCVHGGGTGGNWVASATVYPGRNGAQAPFGSCAAKKFYSVVGWTRDGNSAYDFGAIKLNCDVGTRTGWLGFMWQTAT